MDAITAMRGAANKMFLPQRGEFRAGHHHFPDLPKEVDDGIWLVTFVYYDLVYIDPEEKPLQPLNNPFGPKVYAERSVKDVFGPYIFGVDFCSW